MTSFPSLRHKELVAPPRAKHAIGVGVVVMGLAIGTGELILWPHLIVKHGFSLLWLALLGIFFQFILNREIARHVVATGESFFTTSARVLWWSPVFWLFSALLLYVWPGWAGTIGVMLAGLFGFGQPLIWSWFSLLVVLVITFCGRVAYEILEKSLKIIVPIFVVLLVLISMVNLTPAIVVEALRGVLSFGTIPHGVDLMVLLGAVVFAGAGGMLNLCVSLWYRDKGFGMGSYAGRISNPVTGRTEAVSPVGATFDVRSKTNMKRWKSWMQYVFFDQGIIFAGLGFFSLFLLSVNAYAVLSPHGTLPKGVDIAVLQAEIFSTYFGVWGEKIFLLMTSLMLFSVMWAVIDALARMVTDIIHTHSQHGRLTSFFRDFSRVSVHHLYYAIVILVIILGCVLLPLRQPLPWLVLSGVLGGLTMAIYTPMLLYLNMTRLPKPLRPHFFTVVSLIVASLFFLSFFLISIFHRFV
ncbi:MAG: Nramp family divalent metal transporter [Candidatus Moranbacteria bacterium]|nr:Nramp family divalent metal transporter [Candidatus Moranbacteria bacterium]